MGYCRQLEPWVFTSIIVIISLVGSPRGSRPQLNNLNNFYYSEATSPELKLFKLCIWGREIDSFKNFNSLNNSLPKYLNYVNYIYYIYYLIGDRQLKN